MINHHHKYAVTIEWTGNLGQGTMSYHGYQRSYVMKSAGKFDIHGSSDSAFLGDAACWNPEDLLLGSLSACHQLWYLHLCADAGLVVQHYVDHAQGVMEDGEHGGKFTQVVLHPHVTLAAGSDETFAKELHHTAHEKCYIANSVNFPVLCMPEIILSA